MSGRRALELDKEAPEAYNLLGYVAALQGDFEDALEHYQQAIALDDTYLEAILNAAEVLIHPLGELDDAERLCDDALDLAESDDERVDALLLKFDTLLGRNRLEQARTLCERFPLGPYDNPAHAFLVGRAFYEVGQLDKAGPLIRQATEGPVANAEAYYYLGLLLDEQDDASGATASFLKSRQLDVESGRSPWALSYDSFRSVVDRALEALPEELRALIQSDDVFVADLPGVEVVVEGVDPRALLLLDAISSEDDELPRARVFVYQRNAERLGASLEVMIEELSSALRRELEAVTSDTEEENGESPAA